MKAIRPELVEGSSFFADACNEEEWGFGKLRANSEFLAVARKLAGVTTLLLGWRPDEFWRATPEELAAIFEALRGDVPPPVPMREMMERFPDG